jgi:hypothetical protein
MLIVNSAAASMQQICNTSLPRTEIFAMFPAAWTDGSIVGRRLNSRLVFLRSRRAPSKAEGEFAFLIGRGGGHDASAQ